MNVTPIEWTTFSANPIKYRDAAGNIVWGCVHASPGCTNCYSGALAKRYGRGGPFNVQTMAGLTPFLGEAECHQMRTAKQIGGLPVSGSRCFIGDMTDIFGEWVSNDLLNQLFSNVLEVRTDVTWQLLTKRAERMHDYLSWRWGEGRIPSRNIHVGVSVENQHFADERIPLLLKTPAAVRFISAEPLLEHVHLDNGETSWLTCTPSNQQREGGDCCMTWLEHGDRHFKGIDWVIIGGESGPSARPFDVEWGRSIVSECRRAGVTVFVKQLGSFPVVAPNDRYADVRLWASHVGLDCGRQAPSETTGGPRPYRPTLRSHKGNDIAEWPNDLRVREFPTVRA